MCAFAATSSAFAAPGDPDISEMVREKPEPESEGEPDPMTVAPSRFGVRPADEAFGAFQRGLYLTARNLALPRAEEGDAAAQTLLAEIYSRGLGVARDPAAATQWYKKAAEQGVPEAQLQYALILNRKGADDDQTARARELMKAAADAGNGNAEFNYAQMLVSERRGSDRIAEAYPYFLRAARKGIPDAQYAVSQYLSSGPGEIERDLEKAREWLIKAARQNFDTAQIELGEWYLKGIGGDRDLKRAFAWTIRAARGGNVAAQAKVARLYWGGLGVEPDEAEAAAWYVVSRRAGLRDRALDDFWEGLTAREQRAAIERANALR
ncbi:sel1 repeat family protein [Oricola cellulosilytica]|uniref:Sel1 repeat family protein n=2 Tax=Oricola cellulosilytica TaxID=1429082 RepID=A0A4R0P3Q7_9HYPH|nr:sel1 repeat family protein [Oricola cellulosilytica]